LGQDETCGKKSSDIEKSYNDLVFAASNIT
jgi:hypothetical protein